MSDGAAPPSESEAARIEVLRRKFPWLIAGATLEADPDLVVAELPAKQWRCHACGVSGHDRRNCPTLPKIKRRCAWCRTEGHIAKTCPSRPAGVAPAEASLLAKAALCRRCRGIGHVMSACTSRPARVKHCGFCREKGHQIETCARRIAEAPTFPIKRQKRPPVYRCGTCGDPGHNARACPLDPIETDLTDLVPAPTLAEAAPEPEPVYTEVGVSVQEAYDGRRRCSICRQPGHRRQRCPHAATAVPRMPVRTVQGRTRARTEGWQEIRRHLREAKRLPIVANDVGDPFPPKPTCRSECADVPRPCPFVSCRHHLYLDVNETTGTIKFNHPDIEPDQMVASCSLDVADEGGATLEAVAVTLGLTRERVRQVEVLASRKAKALVERSGIEDSPDRQHSPLGAAIGDW